MDKNQEQTQNTFGFKWKDKKNTYESEAVQQKVYDWLVQRYFGSEQSMKNKLTDFYGKSILDAGCGNGHSISVLFGSELNNMNYTGIDISDDAIEIAKKRFSSLNLKGKFITDDIQTFKLKEKFDYIFSEGVIHHTSKPDATFKNLISHLKKDGKIMFYVYKKKAPIREFTDDYIREQIKNLSNEEAWNKLVPISNLGKILGDLNIEIDIQEEIELLDIPKGKFNLQRFFYWFFMKAYYDPNYSIDEMNHINFDWYRPLNCYRYEPNEIEKWLKENKLTKERFIVEEAGITVIARKNDK